MSKYSRVLFLLCLFPSLTVANDISDCTDRYYTQALIAQKSGDPLAAQNAARKYISLCRLRPDACSVARLTDMNALVHVVPTPLPSPSPILIPSPVPVEKKKQPKPRSSRIDRNKWKRTSDHLVKEAEAARQSGQLEQALNFYRLAEKLDPKTEEFKPQIAELEKMME